MSSGESRWGKPPPGYIPGLGRGAVGIQTRSDLGPARNIEYIHKINNSSTNIKAKDNANSQSQENENELKDFSETKFNKWNGYEENLFSNTEYDDEDRDADFQYNMVDAYMEERRKSRKEKKEMEFLMKFRSERPTIQQTFSDLKSELKKLNKDDWEKIPDILDFTNKKRKIERYTPNTDMNIQRALNDNQILNAIDPINIGTETPNNVKDDILNDLGKAKNSVLSVVFDKMSDKVSGMNSVNPIGYLTEMNSVIKINSQNEVQDFKKARTILKSILNTDNKNVGGWIAAARLEELDGKIAQARNIIAQAAQNILDSEDVWLEAARLHPPQEAKVILAKGISHLPNSKKLWLTAADMEGSDKAKKSKILRKALESLPTDEEVWKRAVELENEEEAKLLLYRAVECIPTSVDIWLALARLENYNKAKAILNKARMALPENHSIWVHAAKLEEAQNFDNCKVDELIERGIKTLAKNGKIIAREIWHQEAENAEIAGSIKTSSAIIKAAIKSDMLSGFNEEKKQIWIDFTDLSKNRGCIETVRFIYDNLILAANHDIELWMNRIQFEKTFGNDKTIENILSKAVNLCPDIEVFWLMYAKHKWHNESIEAGKQLLISAMVKHPENEQIILAMVKLEKEDNNYEAAKKILANYRTSGVINSAKIWMQSVQILREERNIEEAFNLCEQAISKFPNFPKLWMISAQIKEEMKDFDAAVRIYEKGIENNKNNSTLYICLERLLIEKLHKEGFARRVLETALKALPNDETIWVELVRFERKCKNYSNSAFILSRGLRELPNSGLLWSEAIDTEKPHNKHSKAADALSRIEHNEHIMNSIAKIYIDEKNVEKARKWFENSIRINQDNGDTWAYYYKCEAEIGDENKISEIERRCVEAAPRHGEFWTSVSKQVDNWRMKTIDILHKVAELIRYV